MALNGAGSSMAFAIAPATAIRPSVPAQARTVSVFRGSLLATVESGNNDSTNNNNKNSNSNTSYNSNNSNES